MTAEPPPSLPERIARSLPGLARYVRRRMGPKLAGKESVSDIVQSTCRELLRGMDRFEDRGEASFEAWVRRAAEHKLANRARHWSSQRRDAEPERLGTGDSSVDLGGRLVDAGARRPSGEAELREAAERLERALRELPPDYRDVVLRSQVEGLGHAEIAALTGRTPEAVRKLLARALARLSAALPT